MTVWRAAARPSGRLADAGGLPGSLSARRLLGFATVLAGADGPEAAAKALLAVAASRAGHSSATLMLGRPPHAIAAAGPLAGVLMGLPASVLKTFDGWAAGGGSSRSAQDETGWLLDGKREVAAAGVCGRWSCTAEIGELFAALEAASLRRIRTRTGQVLRRRADTDASPGLGYRPAFIGALREAVGSAAMSSRPC